MLSSHDNLFKDLEAVRQIPVVPTMLKVICQTTDMGFAAVARVTQDRWLACSVRDEVQFGLEEGGELKVETTLCNEIRDHREPVVIDCVDEDPVYKHHHTPSIYGLQSYISVPIILKNGAFFGTLCAIDAKPAKVNNDKVIGMFTMFAELLAFHLQSLDLLERSQTATAVLHDRNKALTQENFDLENFVYTASHDLKSPVANIEYLLDELAEVIGREKPDKEEVRQVIGMMRSSLKRFAVTVKDLTTIVEVDKNSDREDVEEINLHEVVEQVKHDLSSLIVSSDARIKVDCERELGISFSKKNFKSIIYNLLNNAIKYRSPERTPEVLLKMASVDGKVLLSVSDNGMGIPVDKQDKVFTMFKRFHDHVEGSGLGLYIVKRILDNSKKEIRLESTLEKGTTFTITF
ncbi:sensor histidine kinase [Pontibacter litorisediminis]|uniref:sensor histidine kinase n=1 Tax=Pontibacter litorisediminis TaxID=1846260 RepID=UPI0023ED5C1E|nr:GAF domain-containing sensor histidine kinase [Pontibacter litorisediminis]